MAKKRKTDPSKARRRLGVGRKTISLTAISGNAVFPSYGQVYPSLQTLADDLDTVVQQEADALGQLDTGQLKRAKAAAKAVKKMADATAPNGACIQGYSPYR